MIVKYTDETKNFIDFEVNFLDYKRNFVFSKTKFIEAINQFSYWRRDITSTNFSSQLFNLICRADSNNITKCLNGFPEHTVIYLLWYESPSEDEFFKKWSNIKIEDITPETLINNPTSKLAENIKFIQFIRNGKEN